MKCLIFGGGGFLGSHLCDALLTKGYAVRIFDRPNLVKYRVFSEKEAIEWVEGDFVNSEDISRAIMGCDVVFHFVSTTLPKSSNDNPVYDIETNLVATVQMMDLACQHGVKKIIFPSSGGTVYGVPESAPIQESHPLNPICSYGITKLAIEKYLFLYHQLHGLDYCVLRLANPFGERQRISGGQGAIGVFMDKALKDETIEIWGDGNVVRDYVYILDVVDAMLKAIDHRGEEKVFNIGSGKGVSLNNILMELENLMAKKLSINFIEHRAFDVPINILDVHLAKEHLRWEPNTDFQSGLRKTFNWFENLKT